VRHHRVERRPRDFDREVAGAAVTGVDDGRVAARRVGPDEEARDQFDRLLRGGEADAL
jgi:hypothetical protein